MVVEEFYCVVCISELEFMVEWLFGVWWWLFLFVIIVSDLEFLLNLFYVLLKYLRVNKYWLIELICFI